MDRGVVDTAKGAVQITKNIFTYLINWDSPSVSVVRRSSAQESSPAAVSDQTWKRIQRETLQTPTERPGMELGRRSQSSLQPQSILRNRVEQPANRHVLSIDEVASNTSQASLPTSGSTLQLQTDAAIRNAYSANVAPWESQSAGATSGMNLHGISLPQQQADPTISLPGQWQSSGSYVHAVSSQAQSATPEVSNVAGPSTRTLRFAVDSVRPIEVSAAPAAYHHAVNYSLPNTSTGVTSDAPTTANGVLAGQTYAAGNPGVTWHHDVVSTGGTSGGSIAASSGVMVDGKPLAAFGSDYRYAVPHPKNSVSGSIRASAVEGRRASVTKKIKGGLADAARTLYGNAAASHAGLGSLSRHKSRES